MYEYVTGTDSLLPGLSSGAPASRAGLGLGRGLVPRHQDSDGGGTSGGVTYDGQQRRRGVGISGEPYTAAVVFRAATAAGDVVGRVRRRLHVAEATVAEAAAATRRDSPSAPSRITSAHTLRHWRHRGAASSPTSFFRFFRCRWSFLPQGLGWRQLRCGNGIGGGGGGRKDSTSTLLLLR